MRIYLDTCCYNRLFDDQYQARIRLETAAILSVLSNKAHTFIASEILDDELSEMISENKREKVYEMYSLCTEKVMLSEEIKCRAIELN